MTEQQRIRKRECARENRQWKKERHLCVRCGKKDAYTLAGRSCCYECTEAERHRAENRQRTEEQIQKHCAKMREKYAENVSRGICPQCGKRNAVGGYIICPICRAKKKRASAKYRLEHGATPRYLMDGSTRCAKCGKVLDDDNSVNGKQLCRSCYESALRSIKKAKESQTKDSYFRRSVNAYWEYKQYQRREYFGTSKE